MVIFFFFCKYAASHQDHCVNVGQEKPPAAPGPIHFPGTGCQSPVSRHRHPGYQRAGGRKHPASGNNNINQAQRPLK